MTRRNGKRVPKPDGYLKIKYVPLSKIKRLPGNAKKHDLDKLVASYQEFGMIDPIAVNDRSGNDFDGNGRADALDLMKAKGLPPPRGVRVKGGEWLAPIVRGVDLTPRQEKRAALALNRITELGGWDIDALAGIAANDADALAGLFDERELRDLLKGSHTLDHTMSKGYFEDGERNDNYKKLCYRIEAAWKSNGGTAIEMFAGQGHLSYWYRRRFERVVTVDKAKYDDVDHVMPCERFIAEKLQDYQNFDFVDFDDEGSPAEQIKLFFDSIPWRSRGFGLAFTDGILHTLHVRGPWTPGKYLIGDSEGGGERHCSGLRTVRGNRQGVYRNTGGTAIQNKLACVGTELEIDGSVRDLFC